MIISTLEPRNDISLRFSRIVGYWKIRVKSFLLPNMERFDSLR